MRKLFIFALLVLSANSAFACVTYNPSNGTYTVGPDGKVLTTK